ncbi:MAG TPA: hypothetical protein VK206_08350 [Anaerolineales bacterium]|nr:hypothetical protein [Anaerolineales bacterium]
MILELLLLTGAVENNNTFPIFAQIFTTWFRLFVKLQELLHLLGMGLCESSYKEPDPAAMDRKLSIIHRIIAIHFPLPAGEGRVREKTGAEQQTYSRLPRDALSYSPCLVTAWTRTGINAACYERKPAGLFGFCEPTCKGHASVDSELPSARRGSPDPAETGPLCSVWVSGEMCSYISF